MSLEPTPMEGVVVPTQRELAIALPKYETWLRILHDGLGHRSYLLKSANHAGIVEGFLPLALVESRLFGRFLVSLPYLSLAGVHGVSEQVRHNLLDQAVSLADDLDVRYLEIRHPFAVNHPALTTRNDSKALLLRELPASRASLWQQLGSKVRNQVRKAERFEFTQEWGRENLLDDFYQVFCRNMRDLGTPVYGRRLFESILSQLRDRTEICILRERRRPISAALLVHDDDETEVPSAASLRRYNSTNANMLLYWAILCRTIARGNRCFNFGRSTINSSVYNFKLQWGARPSSSCWQYYVRRGTINDVRPDNPKYRLVTRLWRRLPVAVTRWIGPTIVRGIP